MLRPEAKHVRKRRSSCDAMRMPRIGRILCHFPCNWLAGCRPERGQCYRVGGAYRIQGSRCATRRRTHCSCCKACGRILLYLFLPFVYYRVGGEGAGQIAVFGFCRLEGLEVCEPIPLVLIIGYSAMADSRRSLLASRRERRRRGHSGSSRARGRLALRLARQRRPRRTRSLMKRKRQRCASQCFQGHGRKSPFFTRMLACARERRRGAEKRAG